MKRFFIIGLLILVTQFALNVGALFGQDLFFADGGQINFKSDIERINASFLWHCDGASGTADYETLSAPASYSTFYTSNVNIAPVGVNEIQSPGKFNECYYSGDDYTVTYTANYITYAVDPIEIATQPIQIDFWVKFLNGSATGSGEIVSLRGSASANEIGFLGYRNAGVLNFYVREANSSLIQASSADYDDDNWHHWFFTSEYSVADGRKSKLFIDGTLVASATFSSSSISDVEEIQIGSKINSTGGRFQLDEVKVDLTSDLFDSGSIAIPTEPYQDFSYTTTQDALYFAATPPTGGTTPPISGYVAWYDASDESTITDSGGDVSAWADKSGNGYDLSYSGVLDPVTASDTLNGLNVISFNNGYMTGPTDIIPAGAASYTIFIVANLPDERDALIWFGDTTGITTNHHLIFHGENTGSPYMMHRWAGNDLNTAGGSLAYDTDYYFTFAFDGTTRLTRISGSETSDTPTSKNTGNTFAGIGGGNQTYNYNINGGYIAEVIIYHEGLSSGDITSVETYLKNKWGL